MLERTTTTIQKMVICNLIFIIVTAHIYDAEIQKKTSEREKKKTHANKTRNSYESRVLPSARHFASPFDIVVVLCHC